MTRQQAERLQVGDVVAWQGDACHLGDVIGIAQDAPFAIAIRWRTGPEKPSYFSRNDLRRIEPLSMQADRATRRTE